MTMQLGKNKQKVLNPRSKSGDSFIGKGRGISIISSQAYFAVWIFWIVVKSSKLINNDVAFRLALYITKFIIVSSFWSCWFKSKKESVLAKYRHSYNSLRTLS